MIHTNEEKNQLVCPARASIWLTNEHCTRITLRYVHDPTTSEQNRTRDHQATSDLRLSRSHSFGVSATDSEPATL